MPKRNKSKKFATAKLVLIIVTALASFSLLLGFLVRDKNIALFNSKGLIGQEQQNLIIFTVALVMIFAIPTVSFLYFTAWKYRESNTKVHHKSKEHHHGTFSDIIMWLVPTSFIVVLGIVMYTATHNLAPQKLIAADTKPLTIQVVAMNWKWLFIYPEQGIATVNFVQAPVDTPLVFELTADEAPMNSFWIPNLGGQLYAMTGHSNTLNLISDTVGDYPGKSAEINGAGFTGMKFTTRISSSEDFDHWVQEVKQSSDVLDAQTYEKLLEESQNNPPAFYTNPDNNLYNDIVMKYHESEEGHEHH